MRNDSNRRKYRAWAPLYDTFFDPLYRRGRRRAVEALDLRRGQSVLVPGIGTGLDIPTIPENVRVTGIDLSREMLSRAEERSERHGTVVLLEGDVQDLPFPDDLFDAVLCNLVLSVVPDGHAAFSEAWRVLCPGGRMAIYDKFLPEAGRVGLARRVIGALAEALGTDVNRKLSDIVGDTDGVGILSDEPDLLGGQYRVVLLRKRPGAA